jgi:hypothetical protein
VAHPLSVIMHTHSSKQNYSITARAAVPTISGNDQLVNGKISDDSAGKMDK